MTGSCRHVIVHRDPYAYCAHPHIVVAANGTWVAVFNQAPRRAMVLHPPEEPLFHNVVIRSRDRGETWSAPQVVPGYRFHGTECAGLTSLRNGELLLNQWRFDWFPLDLARGFADQSGIAYPDRFMAGWLASPEHETSRFAQTRPEDIAPWARGGGKTFSHLSADQGASFTHSSEIDTAPFSGGYGMRGAAELDDGRLILPLCDVPNYRRVFTVESSDGGRSWSRPSLVAAGEGHEFEEPAIIRVAGDRLVIVLRDNATRQLHQTVSSDGGRSWSAPENLAIAGYPAHLLDLGDGRLLMTYGWRQPDYGIRAVISDDGSASWNRREEMAIRRDLPSRNLGYPATILAGNGELFTIYYGEDGDSVTCIMGSYWRP
ncbi:MAG: exo-alpha-sialidase [Rhizobiales bacterium]|nr:exo-alpha-sialidase [Hyphomicrobiales bacterium]MBI3673102.1 exo-alpha-sialidase [Hyphomicrobiales bacterium]